MRRIPAFPKILATVFALALLAGCRGPLVQYVEEGASYTAEEVLALPDTLEPGQLAEKPSSESKELRHGALVDLRKQGDGANEAAELITRTFSAETVGVPFYVERATFDSTPAVVLVEAIGPPDGTLEDERVWVLGAEKGDVLLSGTR